MRFVPPTALPCALAAPAVRFVFALALPCALATPAARFVFALALPCALSACSASATPPPPRETTAMSSDSSKQLVRRLYADYLNPGHLDRLDEIVSPDFVGPSEQRGAQGFAAPIATLRAAFPDLSYTLEEVVAEGDRVAVRWVWHGTHTGPFRGFAPTGKAITNAGFAIFQVADGKLVRSRVETDRLGFLLAVGAIPYDPAFGPPPAAK